MLAGLACEEGIGVESIRKYEVATREYAGQAIAMSQIGGKWLFEMRPFEELNVSKD